MTSQLFAPGVPADWEVLRGGENGQAAGNFMAMGMPITWGWPTAFAVWFDPSDRMRGASAHFANGRAAFVCYIRGSWRLLFGEAPA